MINLTDDYEIILEEIRFNCVHLNNIHKSIFFYYRSLHKYFRIPTIILSSVASVSSVGLQNYIKQEHINIITCLISLSIGVINSIELYLKINENIEASNEISKSFYNLSIDIHKFLATDKLNRKIEGGLFLNNVFNEYTKLQEKSNLIRNHNFKDKLIKIEKKDSLIKKIFKKNMNESSNSSIETNSDESKDHNINIILNESP